MTATVNGLRQPTVGGIDHRLWIAIPALSARRDRQHTMERLYPPVEV